MYLHGRSGRVALPRTKVAAARLACLERDEAPARRADRTVDVRSRVVDMLDMTDVRYFCRQRLWGKGSASKRRALASYPVP